MKKTIVLYDSWCPICIQSIKRFKKMDWFKRLEFFSFRDEDVLTNYPIEMDKLEKRIHSITRSGYVENGIYTINRICKNIPLLWIFILCIYISILFGFGQRLYDWIADRRFGFPTGCNEDSCAISHSNKVKHKK